MEVSISVISLTRPTNKFNQYNFLNKNRLPETSQFNYMALDKQD